MAKSPHWTRDQLLVALRLYCRTPFGKLDQRNPEIIRVAGLIGRTPSALGMKACNFASLDPAQLARGIKGLKGRSKADEQLWADFEENAEAIAAESEAAYERFTEPTEIPGILKIPGIFDEPTGPTESERLIRTRRVQSFFRQAVLVSYDNRCALTGLAVPALLTASHIIPWSENEQRRADPRNGLCLNPLHDKAFDRGFITFDEDLRVVVSRELKTNDPPLLQAKFLVGMEREPLRLPSRFQPDAAAMGWHRENVFGKGYSR